jgi:type I restriction enzyme R subunit
MIGKISERRFEDAIECVLLGQTPDACDDFGLPLGSPETSYLGLAPGGYRRRASDGYDKDLCLFPQDVLDFVYATQPKEWGKLKEHHGKDAQTKFLARIASEISNRGLLDVLRNGVKDSGVMVRLAYFQPSSGLNEETFRLYEANMFTVVRQLHYSKRDGWEGSEGRGEKGSPSLDLVLCLNGLPLFTAELKNPLNGKDVQDAIRQYKETRDPREPLLKFKRCLAHFAVDPELVFVTTQLAKEKTRFLPFNQGRDKGAGNPQPPPSRSSGYATDYLWNHVWARDSVLELIRRFIQDIIEEDEDENGNKVKRNFLLFPRYHQLDTVRRLVRDARVNGAGKRYLVQHSAGSGKSYTLAWLAHQLSTLHDGEDNRVFDSILVITDRRILDKQLQNTMLQLEHTLGVVENIEKTSSQLRDALQAGKTIIVTTLQKFPAMLEQIRELAEKKPGEGKHAVAGKRFAVIVDEAHSSQSGETSEAVNRVFASENLEEAAKLEEAPQKDFQDKLVDNAEGRKYPPNMSVFAFTATPKAKTLEHFGVRRSDGQFEAFSLYSMRQAIEEGFIRDVLENYTTYEVYWRLLKRIEDDPRYEKGKATYLLKSFVDLHPHAIREKIAVIVNHFDAQVKHQIAGKAKAMIVTRSRLHAVRYKLALDAYLAEKGLAYKALVAFSGTVEDGGKSYTETGMNGFPETQTASTFKKPEYRFLVVAEKFQTGFDQPLLHTMYVDKKLSGLNAVQTLSRLNRTHPDKTGTMVLDFANEAEDIRKAFEVYFEATLLSEATDPNQLYELQRKILGYGVFDMSEVMGFAAAFHDAKSGQDRLYALLAPVTARVEVLDDEPMAGLRGHLDDFTRLYAFLSQILTFADADLEALYPFAKYLRRLIQGSPEELPREIQQNIDMESYRLQQTGNGNISMRRGNGKLEPVRPKEHPDPGPEEIEPLSRILAELNERFGLNLGPEHKITLGQIMGRLENDFGLDASARVNARENIRLTFEHKFDDAIEEVVDSNFEFYRRIRDDKAFGEALTEFAFEQYLRNHRKASDLVKQQESKTLEFKSTLRWSLKENKQDNVITHAVLKTIAAFLNTDGGDLLIGVADDGSVLGLDPDGFDNTDKFMLHLTQTVHNALGAHAAKRIDPRTQVVDGKTVCLVTCQRGQEPVRLKWKSLETMPEGDYFVRMGPGSKKLTKEEAEADIKMRFGWKAD